MRIKLSFRDFVVWIIFIFAFLSCVSYMIYTIKPIIPLKIINYLCLLMTDSFCLLYLFTQISHRTYFYGMVFVLSCFVIFELCIAISTKSFVFPNVIGDVITWPLLFITLYKYTAQNKPFTNLRMTSLFFIFLIYIVSVPCVLFRTGSSVFSVYYCISFLPLIYLLCSKRAARFCSVISVILIIMTAKSAALIIAIL